MIRSVWLVHPEEAMGEAFRARFEGLPGVRVVQGTFEQLEPHDCFVTAGNSFGIMNAGIDAAVVRVLGESVQERVQHRIMDRYLGELPVGTAFVEATGDARIPFLAYAPTMRVPGSIEGTDHVYRATWAALVEIHAHNVAHARDGQPIEVVAMPAMGTGFGGVPFGEAARQMAAAYRHYLDPPHRLDWDFVIRRQKGIQYDGDRQVCR